MMTKRDGLFFRLILRWMEKHGFVYSDLKIDCDGDVEAITFSNNEMYINKVQEIEYDSPSEVG